MLELMIYGKNGQIKKSNTRVLIRNNILHTKTRQIIHVKYDKILRFDYVHKCFNISALL